MKTRRAIYQFIAIYLFLLPAAADTAENDIFWQIYHRPPGIFIDGEFAGKGFVQKALHEVTSRLPQYQHIMVRTSLARALMDIQNQKQVCHPALFKTPERQTFIEFSVASLVHPTNRLVMRRSLARILFHDNVGTINLLSLLNNEKLTFALIHERKFGANIDQFMAQVNLGDRLVSIPSENLDNMLNMVSRGRTDITIAYPFEIEHFNQALQKPYETLDTFVIEDVPAYSMGYIACPDNDWGKTVINDINNVLRRIRHKPDYRNAITTWWREEAKAPNFAQYYEQVFLEN
ncbi:MAG: TIGR02285 family protein [Aestuariibacter sp.]